MVIHVVRPSRAAAVVSEVLGGHRPALWVSDLYGAQQGHADGWQICLAHQLRDCQYAIDAGDAVFAPRMKALLLRAVVLARRHRDLAASTRREYRRRLEHALDAMMALAPTARDGRRLRKRYAKVRDHCSPFSITPNSPPTITAANESFVRQRPTARSQVASDRTGAPTCSPRPVLSSEPLPVAASMPTARCSLPYEGTPNSTRVEQIP